MQDLVRPRPADPGDQPLVAEERVQASRLAVDDLAEPLGPEAERLRSEVRELGLRRLGREEPDAGALLLSALREDELSAAGELEPERRRLRRLPAGRDVAEPARGHQVDEEDELAVLGREEETFAAAFRPAEATPLERRERRIEGLQRCDVPGAGLRDRERRDGIVQLAPPRLHLGKLRHRASLAVAQRVSSSAAAGPAPAIAPLWSMPAATPGASPPSPAATVGSASSGSGNVFSLRIGESKIGTVLVKPPAAPTTSAVRRPKLEAIAPPVSEPSGIGPHTRKRITEFMRPCNRSGVIAWRRDTCWTL